MTQTVHADAGREPRSQSDDLSQLLRRAMRGIAATVTVITVGGHGKRHAMSATSFTPLSLNPASVLFCIDRKSTLYPHLEGGLGFCVNLLLRSHEGVARTCGNSAAREKRFAAGDFDVDQFGVPYLRDAQATIHCQPDGRYLYGSHAIIIGKARAITVSDEIDPLVYFNGRYASVARE